MAYFVWSNKQEYCDDSTNVTMWGDSEEGHIRKSSESEPERRNIENGSVHHTKFRFWNWQNECSRLESLSVEEEQ